MAGWAPWCLLAAAVGAWIGLGTAIPWASGNIKEENQAGRVEEFDQFLVEHAKELETPDTAGSLLSEFILLTKSVNTDPECSQYYTTLLMSLSKDGKTRTMQRERNKLHTQIANSMSHSKGEGMAFAFKKRHILDAFEDALNQDFWSQIKTEL